MANLLVRVWHGLAVLMFVFGKRYSKACFVAIAGNSSPFALCRRSVKSFKNLQLKEQT